VEVKSNIDFIQEYDNLKIDIPLKINELESRLSDTVNTNVSQEVFRELTSILNGSGKVIQSGQNVFHSSHQFENAIFRISYNDQLINDVKFTVLFRNNSNNNYYRLTIDPAADGLILLEDIRGKKSTVLDTATTSSQLSSKENKTNRWLHVVLFDENLYVLDKEILLMVSRDLDNLHTGTVDINVENGDSAKENYFIKFEGLSEKAYKLLRARKLPERLKESVNREYHWNCYSPAHILEIEGKETNPYLQRVRLNFRTERAFVLPVGSNIVWDGIIPKFGRLDFSIGMINKYIADFTRIRFNVKIEGNFEKSEKVFRLSRENYNSDSWQPVSLDLKNLEGKYCKIILSAEIEGDPAPFDKKVLTLWGNPVIRGERVDDDLNVILISLDTLRGDHLGSYGYHRDTTPIIDSYGNKGVIFLNTVASSSWTLPSHMSMFTGLYPTETGAESEFKHDRNVRRSYLVHDVMTLAEYLKDAGYATHAETGGGFVSAHYGHDQGFETFSENRLGPWDRDIALEVPKAIEWIRKNKETNFFLFFHTFEIHHVYLRRFFKHSIPDSLKDEIIANYDSGIRYTDKYIGELLDTLKAEGLDKNTVIVLTSDHGENFDFIDPDNNIFSGKHGRTLKDSELMIPLMIWGPDSLNSGKKVREQVRSVDIVPTVLDILNIEARDVLRGKTLLNLINLDKEKRKRVAYAEGIRIWQEPYFDERAIRTMEYKLLQKLPLGEKYKGSIDDLFSLYNLTNDPMERKNIYPGKGKKPLDLRNRLEKLRKNIEKRKSKLKPSKFRDTITNELYQQLKDLGYIN